MALRSSALGPPLLLALALATGLASAKDWTRIRVASEGAHPPFNSLDAMNQLQGFEIDLAREVCRRLRATCEFMTQDFAGIIPALIAGRYDIAFASLTITPPREANVAFSKKYYDARAMFVDNKAKPVASTAPKAMKGLKVGAKIASTSARYLQDHYVPQGAVLKLYHTIDEARLDLAEGRIDALLGDKTAMVYWLANSPLARCCEVTGDDLTDPAYFGRGVGAAMRKDDVELKELVDAALTAIRADGTYSALRKKYFSFDPY
ncbi:MAG: amino acid ABC transporter [Ancylobacter novellus]|uniref:Amino acid ABC transporter n=1 Tax=Ancylobacter novellus TaxID=921 RepID=A0A2W5KLH3_ANCNO|nr:MAG: amino acid ABC transporter [Ancylobacter novellus]